MKRTVLKSIIAVLIFILSFSLAMAVSTYNTTDNIKIDKESPTQKATAITKKTDKSDTSKANKTEKATKEQSTLVKENPTEAVTTEQITEFQQEIISEVSTLAEELPAETPTEPQNTDEKNARIIGELGYYSLEQIEGFNCRQLIIVKSFSNNAQIYMFEKDDIGIWNPVEELSTDGFVGKMGVSNVSYEGSYETPAGLFAVGSMFYIDNKPETKLNKFFQVTENTYWVDDPNSQSYNMLVQSTENMDWNSAEHMIDYYSSYKYGFVIDFNTNPIEKGRGSAIFFHIGYEPTAGCVAVSEDMMLAYLARLDSGKNPYILIQ